MGDFTTAAKTELRNPQLRANLRKATTTIRAKRAAVVGEVDEWEALRDAGQNVKQRAMAALDEVSRAHEEFRLRLAADKEVRLAALEVQSKVAEAQASAEVRAAAAEHAARAAEIVLTDQMKGSAGTDLVAHEIGEIKRRLS